MKQTLLLLFFVLLGVETFSQPFNRTYWDNSNNFMSKCIVPELNAHSIFFSANTDYYMSLSKTDLQGFWKKTIFLDTQMLDHRMIETRDSGVLLAAYVDSLLLILKFNNNLQLLWSKKVPMGIDIFKPSGRNTVDIEAGKDSMGHEVFYILSGTPTY